MTYILGEEAKNKDMSKYVKLHQFYVLWSQIKQGKLRSNTKIRVIILCGVIRGGLIGKTTLK